MCIKRRYRWEQHRGYLDVALSYKHIGIPGCTFLRTLVSFTMTTPLRATKRNACRRTRTVLNRRVVTNGVRIEDRDFGIRGEIDKRLEALV